MATRFGDFMLKEELGSSSYADRFVGMHDNLGGPFFIKRYPRLPEPFTSDLALRCEHLMRLKHHVLTPHLGHGDVDGVPFVVSPLLDGVDLRTFADSLRSRRVVLPMAAMLFILREVARGVEALHLASPLLAHGNVTARHIRIGTKGEVWLTGLPTPRGDVAGQSPAEKWDGAGVAATTYDLIGLTRPTRDRPPLPTALDRLVRRGLGIGKPEETISAGDLADGLEEIAVSLSVALHQGVLAEVASRTTQAHRRAQGRTAAEKLPTLEPIESPPRAPPSTLAPPHGVRSGEAPVQRALTPRSQKPVPPPRIIEPVAPRPPHGTPEPPTFAPPRDRSHMAPTQKVEIQPIPVDAMDKTQPLPAQALPGLPSDEPFDFDSPFATTGEERDPVALHPTVENPVIPPRGASASTDGLVGSFSDEMDSFVDDGRTRPEMATPLLNDHDDGEDDDAPFAPEPTVELRGPVASDSSAPNLPPEVDSIFRHGGPVESDPPDPELGRLFADMGSPAPAGRSLSTGSFLVDPVTEAARDPVAPLSTVPRGKAAPPPSTDGDQAPVAPPAASAPPPPASTGLAPPRESAPVPTASVDASQTDAAPPALSPLVPSLVDGGGTPAVAEATPAVPEATPAVAEATPAVAAETPDRSVAALLRSGRLSSAQLDAGVAVQRTQGGHIVDILVSQGALSESAVADVLANEAVKQRIDAKALSRKQASTTRLRRMPEPYALSHCLLVLDGPEDGPLTLAMADPFDQEAVVEVRRMFDASLVQVQVAERTVLRRAIQSAYGLASPAPEGVAEGQPTLLLCSNEDAHVTAIGARFAAEGFAVEHAATGTLAVRLLQKQTPNAVLCDYALPGASEDVLLATRRLDVPDEVPFFMFGDDEDGEIEARCLDLSADDFFSVPLKLDLILRKVRRAIVKNSRKMRRAPTKKAAAAPPEEPTGPPAFPLHDIPDGPGVPEEFGMVVTDVPAEPTGVMGTLKQMAVSEIVQSLEMGRKTARVELVPHDAEPGRFWFDSGQIVYAECGTELGEKAFYQLARHTQGFFRISYGDMPTQRNIEKPTTFLLLEAMRLMDEEGQL